MKSYTDLEQSKKLAEILPLESADLCYVANSELINIHEPFYKKIDKDDIPCWSLAALFNVIPQEIYEGEYIINITEGRDDRWVLNYDHIDNRTHTYYGLATGADNLVDTCYKMILKLHEHKIL